MQGVLIIIIIWHDNMVYMLLNTLCLLFITGTLQLSPRTGGPLTPPASDLAAIEYVGTLNGIRYVMYNQLLGWTDAKAYCEANGQVRACAEQCMPSISTCVSSS